MRLTLKFLAAPALIALFALLMAALSAAGTHRTMAGADSATKKAYEHFDSLDYDRAIPEFEKIVAEHRDDPFAVNHLLTAVLFRELYRADALDTTIYSKGNSFLDNKVAVPIDARTKARIEQLANDAINLAEKRLQENPNDVDALYARGVTRGLRSTYMGIAEKAWFAALRNALGARRDHERVLELDPGYADAKTVVGVHNYVIGSLPFAVKAMAGVVGFSGNREKGIRFLREAAAAGGESSQDAKVALGLFLRREGRYDEALPLARELTNDHPRNYLFALEIGNLQRDAGKNSQAAATYRKILADAAKGAYIQPHLEFAYFGLGSSLQSQGDVKGAFDAFSVVTPPAYRKTEMERTCVLRTGEMLDQLNRRAEAKKKYQQVIDENSDSNQAEQARKYLNAPFHMG